MTSWPHGLSASVRRFVHAATSRYVECSNVALRDDLLQSMHGMANHAAIINACGDTLGPMVARLVLVTEGQVRLIENAATRLEAETAEALRASSIETRDEILETQKIVDDLVSASQRLVATVDAARRVVKRIGVD